MKVLAVSRYALGVCASVAFLAACSTGGSQLAPTIAMQRNQGIANSSWMKSDAMSKQLLYVSDPGTNDVQVYAYPKMGSPSLEGTLTGFDGPRGECVDPAGNIWITNTSASTIVEFAHGGTSPIATLSDPGQLPASCAIDVASGDLAVVNLMSGSKSGSVSIYKNAHGAPTTYSAGEIVQPFFVSYVDAFLYVDGLLSGGTSGIAYKRPKNEHFTNRSLSVSIASIGGLQWDGTYLAVGGRIKGNNVIYRFGVGRFKLNLKQTLPIKKACAMMQFFVAATTVVVPDARCPSANTYKYPGGGLPMTKKVIGKNLVAPFGSAISP